MTKKPIISEPQITTTHKEFWDHVEFISAEVEKWPDWKKNLYKDTDDECSDLKKNLCKETSDKMSDMKKCSQCGTKYIQEIKVGRAKLESNQHEIGGRKCLHSQLKKLTDKLPKTADGVAVVPHADTVCEPYTPPRSSMESCGRWIYLDKKWYVIPDFSRKTLIPIEECFSTGQAAEQARKMKNYEI